MADNYGTVIIGITIFLALLGMYFALIADKRREQYELEESIRLENERMKNELLSSEYSKWCIGYGSLTGYVNHNNGNINSLYFDPEYRKPYKRSSENTDRRQRVRCVYCGRANPSDLFDCKYCGAPLNDPAWLGN